LRNTKVGIQGKKRIKDGKKKEGPEMTASKGKFSEKLMKRLQRRRTEHDEKKGRYKRKKGEGHKVKKKFGRKGAPKKKGERN